MRVDITMAAPEAGHLVSIDVGTGRHTSYDAQSGSLATGSLSIDIGGGSQSQAWQLPWLTTQTVTVTLELQPGERSPLAVTATVSY